MSKKNKKAEIIKNEQQIQGVIPALLAVDAAMGIEAIQVADQLKTKRKALKEKAQDDQEQDQSLAEGSEIAEETLVADLIQLVDSDISLTQSKDNCKINSKGVEECDEGGAWWKALLGLGLLGALAGGGGGGGGSAPAPVVVGSNTFRHRDFDKREDQDDYLNIRTTNFNEVNLVLTGTEHLEEGTDFLNGLIDDDAFPYEGDRQLAVDFAGSSNIAVFNSSITNDQVGLRFDYSELDGGASNTALHTVTMAVNTSVVELEGGHSIEEDDLRFTLTVSNDSTLFNHGGLTFGESVDIGNFTALESYDILSFESSDIATYGLISLLESTEYWLAEDDTIYSSSDFSEEYEVGYINDQNDIIINGDNVGEIHDGQIYLNSIDGYADADLVNIDGSGADVDIRVSGGSVVYSEGNLVVIDGNSADVSLNVSNNNSYLGSDAELVLIEGTNASVNIDVTAGAVVDAEDHIVRIYGADADVSILVSGDGSHLQSSSSGFEIVHIDGSGASVELDVQGGASVDAVGEIIDIDGDNVDVTLNISGGSSVDSFGSDGIYIDGLNASVDIDVTGGSSLYAQQNLIVIDGDSTDVSLNISSGSVADTYFGDIVSIDGANASVDIDVTNSSDLYGEDSIVDIVGANATVSMNVATGSYVESYWDDAIRIDGHFASVDIDVSGTSSVDADESLVEIDGNSAYVDLTVSGNSDVDSHNGNMIDIVGTDAFVGVDVSGASEVRADDHFISILGENAEVSLDVTGTGSFVDAESLDVISVAGDDATVDINVTLGADLYGHQRIVDIIGANADVSLNVSGNGSYVSSEYDDAISIVGINASVDIDVTDGAVAEADNSLVDISGNSADVHLTVSGNSYVENMSDDMIILLGNDASAEIYISGASDVYADDNFLNIEGSNADVILDVTGLGTYLEAQSNDVINIVGINASVDMDVTQYARVVAQDSIVDIEGVDAEVSINVASGSSVDTQSDDAVNIVGANAWVDIDVTGVSSVDAADSLVDIGGNSADVYLTVSGNSYVENQSDDMIIILGTSGDIVSASVDIEVTGSSEVYAAKSLVDVNYGLDSADDTYVSLLVSGDGTLVRNNEDHSITINGDRATVDIDVLDGAELDARDSLVKVDANHVTTNTDFTNLSILVSGDGSQINNIDTRGFDDESGDSDYDFYLVDLNSVNSSVDLDVQDGALIALDGGLISILSDSDTDSRATVNNSHVDINVSGDSTISGDGVLVRIDRGSDSSVNLYVNDSSIDMQVDNTGGDPLISIDGHDATVNVTLVNDASVKSGGDTVHIDGGPNAVVTVLVDDSVLNSDYGDLVDIDGHDASVAIEINNSANVTLGGQIVEIDDGDRAVISLLVSQDSTVTFATDSYAAAIEVDTGNYASIDVDIIDSQIYGDDAGFIYVDGEFASIDLFMTAGAELKITSDYDSDNEHLIEVDGDDAQITLKVINDSTRSYEEGGDDLDIEVDGDGDADLINIQGHRATVNVQLISDVDSNADNADLDVTVDDDFIDIIGDFASVDIELVSADLDIGGDLVDIEGDNAYVNIVSTNPQNDNSEETEIDAGSLVDIDGHNARVNVAFEILDSSNFDSDFVIVEGDDASIDINLGGTWETDVDVDYDVVDINGLRAYLNLNITSQLANSNSGDEGSSYSMDSLIDLSGQEALLSVNVSNIEVDVDYDFIRAQNADDIHLTATLTNLNVAMNWDSGDVFNVQGDDAHLDIIMNDVSISSDFVDNGFYSTTGNLVDVQGNDLELTFSAEDLRVRGSWMEEDQGSPGGFYVSGRSANMDVFLVDSFFGLESSDFIKVLNGHGLELTLDANELGVYAGYGFDLIGNNASLDIAINNDSYFELYDDFMMMRGDDAKIDLDLSDSEFNASGDFLRVLNGDRLNLTLDADDVYISAYRGFNVEGNQASLDIDFANNDLDLGGEMIQVSGQDAQINLSLTNVDIDAADGINLTSRRVTEGHELSIELNDVSMDFNTGEFLSVREGVGLVLDITANDVQISADSFVNVSDASGAQINVNMTGVSAFGEFVDNMFNIEGADSSTDINISLTNFGDGGFADLYSEVGINVAQQNPFFASGDILNITGESSEFDLSITGLMPVGFGIPGPFLLGGVNGHGDLVDLTGSNNQGAITLRDSIFVLDDYTGMASPGEFILSSKTGILELIGDGNSIDISVHDTNFLAISADYTNSTMIDVVGEGNRISVDFTDVVMHTLAGESWEFFGEDNTPPNDDIPPYQLFLMGEDRLNLLNMNGDSSDFTLDTYESIFNTRVEMHGDNVNYIHNDHGAESEFNSVHMYMDVESSDITVSLDGSFSLFDGSIGHEGVAYGGVVVGNSNTINFNIDSQHLSLRTYGYTDDVNFNLSDNGSLDIFEELGLDEAGLLISSDVISTSTINFNLDGRSHLDGYLDLTAADVGVSSGDIVNYNVNLRASSNSTAELYLTSFGEDVVVNLELDNLNNNVITQFGSFSGDVESLIHLLTSYGAEVNISMAEDGNENFYFNHWGTEGHVNLVAENFNNRDNFDAIDLDWNSSMEYTNFNSAHDTLVVGNTNVDVVNDYDGTTTGLSSTGNESTDLVLFADGVSAGTLITAITNLSLDDWYDDVYLVFGEDSVDGDVFIYRWDGTDNGELVATLIDAYDEIFDTDILAIVDREDIITTQLYEHRYEYAGWVVI